MHAAALAYSSDTTVLDSVLTTHGLSWGLDRIGRRDRQSLDLVPSSVPVRRVGALRDGVSGRGRIAWSRNRSVLHAQGELIATVVQEGVIRHFPARR